MTVEVGKPGWERFSEETKKEINLDAYYDPYPMQYAYHKSPARHRLLGGAAGPGKSLCGIMDHFDGCNSFTDQLEARQVHTLLLRRTAPQLDDSLVTRFREKVPSELYQSFQEQKKIVTWLNGSTSRFGSMQYDSDVWNYQGSQWWKIFFDELTQFTFYQWNTISAWNRCPVSPFATKDGGTNPVGIGAGFVNDLFVKKKPCAEMDEHQRGRYNPAEYAYFPCTYLDNPIYANDPVFIANMQNYPRALRDALMHGLWGAFGTFFGDVWDPAVHIYDPALVELPAFLPRWLSADWGFEHNSAIYWHSLDVNGICRTYRELVVNHRPPKTLAEEIIANSYREDGTLESYEPYMFFSHDAFHKKQDVNTIANQITEELQKALGVQCINAGTDKMGGEQLMYQMLKDRVKLGEVFYEGESVSVEQPLWQISAACPKLGDVMGRAPRDDKKPNEIADFLGNDPIDGARHGIYGKFSGKVQLPLEMRIAARVTSKDPTVRALQATKAELEERRKTAGRPLVRPRWRSRLH